MTEQELRDTIVEHIIRLNNVCKTNAVCKDCKYANYDRCTEYAIADALIAAGLTFDKATAILAKRTNGKTLILKAQYYDQIKHKAKVAEKALRIVCEMQENLTILVDGRPWTKEEIYNRYIQQAEKELAEEGKDD